MILGMLRYDVRCGMSVCSLRRAMILHVYQICNIKQFGFIFNKRRQHGRCVKTAMLNYLRKLVRKFSGTYFGAANLNLPAPGQKSQ